MPIEERREIVTDDQADPDPTVVRHDTVVEQRPRRVVEEPSTTYVRSSDPVGNSMAATSLIQTVVWSVVVIVILVIGILVLLHYNII